jgi:hypothetical protein
MTDAHTPADGPEEPAEPPDGRAGPSMPPDPFAPADTAHALVVATLHGLRRNGAGLVEACLTTAARDGQRGQAAAGADVMHDLRLARNMARKGR